MNFRKPAITTIGVVAILNIFLQEPARSDAADTIRSRAVVNLTFDEESGDAGDSASAGQHQDQGKLVNDPQRIASPFWGQENGNALVLNAGRKQFVQVPDSPDLDRPSAVSFSFFFLSLHDLTDGTFHGIVAKRSAEQPSVTNYGINYRPQSDSFQVYVNDGGGFKVANFSVREIVGQGRRAFLTATFEVGDAPDPDADRDDDDLRIRLFVNGQQATPTSVNSGGTVVGKDAWIQDLNVAGLLNDVPVTIGSSTPQSEYTSGLFDEFSLFAEALTPEEISQLFLEVAGPDATQLAQQESQPPQSPAPKLQALSFQGMEIGKTTRLVIQGENLMPDPLIALPIDGLEYKVSESSTAKQLTVEFAIPKQALAGFYPLWVQTATGLSNALPIAIDRLPQLPAADTSPDNPADLPAAFSGILSGTQQSRVYFQGQAGQRVVADVEARRLGAGMNPVLEVKTARGTPLIIEWGKIHLRGDARAEIQLPSDGLYFVELHDLSYQAPGQNPYRLKVGDLKLIDMLFPPAISTDTKTNIEPIGSGVTPESAFAIHPDPADIRAGQIASIPERLRLSGPAPAVRFSDGMEIIEQSTSGDSLQTIDAKFAEAKHVPLIINGRISRSEEQDRYLLEVTPGQKLSFALAGRSINSPLDGKISIRKHPEGDVLAANNDAAGTRDSALDYPVPGDVSRIQVSVEDLFERGGPHFLYRLQIIPADQPDFQLTVLTPKVTLPREGTTIVQVQVNRSAYDGPIRLQVAGDEHIQIEPQEIPGGTTGKVFLRLIRKGEQPTSGFRRLRIVGQSVGLKPEIRRIATVSQEGNPVAIPGYDDVLPVALQPAAPLSLEVAEVPTTLLKGWDAEIPVTVLRKAEDAAAGQAVRLTLLSTEAPRQVDPNDAGKGNKPLVRSLPYQAITAGAESGKLKVAVPLDVAEPKIHFVIKGELVPNAYSRQVLATAFSRPFALPIQNAVSLKFSDKKIILTSETPAKITGTLRRTAPFAEAVELTLKGLPEGYMAGSVTVAADEEQFELQVTAPKVHEETPLKDVTLSVKAAGKDTMLLNQKVELTVVPAKGKEEGESQ